MRILQTKHQLLRLHQHEPPTSETSNCSRLKLEGHRTQLQRRTQPHHRKNTSQTPTISKDSHSLYTPNTTHEASNDPTSTASSKPHWVHMYPTRPSSLYPDQRTLAKERRTILKKTTQPLFCHYFTIVFSITKNVMFVTKFVKIVTLFVMVLLQQHWFQRWDQYHTDLNWFHWAHWTHWIHWFHWSPQALYLSQRPHMKFFELILNLFEERWTRRSCMFEFESFFKSLSQTTSHDHHYHLFIFKRLF